MTASSGKTKIQPMTLIFLRFTFSSEKWWSNRLLCASWKYDVGFKSDNICESSWKLRKSIQVQRIIISHADKTVMCIYSFKSLDTLKMSILGPMPGAKATQMDQICSLSTQGLYIKSFGHIHTIWFNKSTSGDYFPQKTNPQ